MRERETNLRLLEEEEEVLREEVVQGVERVCR